MNTDYLRYFHRAAVTGNFTTAAKELFITTSALSKAIHALEKELGVPLFIRKGRNVVLTAYGATFDVYAEKAYNLLTECAIHLQNQQANANDTMLLTAEPIIAAGPLSRWIRDFKAAEGQVSVAVRCAARAEVLTNIRQERHHLGFCGAFDHAAYPDLKRRLLYEEPLALVVPASHPLAGHGHVGFTELRREPFILTGVQNDAWQRLCARHGISPPVAVEADSNCTALELVRAGMGIALIPLRVMADGHSLSMLRLDEEQTGIPRYVVWKAHAALSPAARRFLDRLPIPAAAASSRSGPGTGMLSR